MDLTASQNHRERLVAATRERWSLAVVSDRTWSLVPKRRRRCLVNRRRGVPSLRTPTAHEFVRDDFVEAARKRHEVDPNVLVRCNSFAFVDL